MPPKKIKWGEIPNESEIMEKDRNGKWICCKLCDVRIKVRSQFSITEWQMHTDGLKHKELANSKAVKNTPKLTTFFKRKTDSKNAASKSVSPPPKKCKTVSCPGFYYGNNSDLVPLYAKYKKKDEMSDSIKISCNNGKWSIYSIYCTGEQVHGRKSLRRDNKACEACFNFPSLSQIKFRIRRMESNLHIEQYLLETKSSETASIAISKFLKTNLKSASPETMTLIHRCKHYQKHHQ